MSGDRLATRCVRAGERPDRYGAPFTPLYSNTAFGFRDTESLIAAVQDPQGAFYSRYGQNPTIQALEDKMAALEGADGALAFSSGMAAISAALLAHVAPGQQIICVGSTYGGTYRLMTDQLAQLGIGTARVGVTDLQDLEGTLPRQAAAFFMETPANPTLEVADIAAVAATAHRADATLIVDNTFATPINQRPMEHGADLVVHSATKYLGGHSDLIGGIVAGTETALAPLRQWRRDFGLVMSPPTAFLLCRSLRTLAVRIWAHNAAAIQIAEWLTEHPRVASVHHPSRQATENPAVRRQMDGYGGMVSFEYRGDAAATATAIERLRLFTLAPSLGGVESLVTQPAITSHRDLSPLQRQAAGIGEGLVRLSCGLEDPDDLVADLAQALDQEGQVPSSL